MAEPLEQRDSKVLDDSCQVRTVPKRSLIRRELIVSSLTIDEGAQRDHLGLLFSLQFGHDCQTDVAQHSSAHSSATYELPLLSS